MQQVIFKSCGQNFLDSQCSKCEENEKMSNAENDCSLNSISLVHFCMII
jgi:hypothetical protein